VKRLKWEFEKRVELRSTEQPLRLRSGQAWVAVPTWSVLRYEHNGPVRRSLEMGEIRPALRFVSSALPSSFRRRGLEGA
jgi:hypothetical protein